MANNRDFPTIFGNSDCKRLVNNYPQPPEDQLPHYGALKIKDCSPHFVSCLTPAHVIPWIPSMMNFL